MALDLLSVGKNFDVSIEGVCDEGAHADVIVAAYAGKGLFLCWRQLDLGAVCAAFRPGAFVVVDDLLAGVFTEDNFSLFHFSPH